MSSDSSRLSRSAIVAPRFPGRSGDGTLALVSDAFVTADLEHYWTTLKRAAASTPRSAGFPLMTDRLDHSYRVDFNILAPGDPWHARTSLEVFDAFLSDLRARHPLRLELWTDGSKDGLSTA
eukprot:3861211-Amphidinium_carterae.1